MEIKNTIGRRKTSVARVYIQPGKGRFTVNNKEAKVYFPSDILNIIINQPFNAVNELASYDVNANVRGGGITGQAEAIRLGIARALTEINSDFKPALKKEGFLTRDSRAVERKKYGKKKARKRFQFSKR